MNSEKVESQCSTGDVHHLYSFVGSPWYLRVARTIGNARLLYIPIVDISFGAYMLIMNQGIHMFVGELSTAFKAFPRKLLPDALIGVDGMALAPYAPMLLWQALSAVHWVS